MEAAITYHTVNDHYSRLAREMAQGHDEHSQKAALSFGYSADELSAIPEGSNLGVSCGNPIALAALKEGETVVDLGSGAGFDVFLAARKIGPSGLAIGVDMSKDMLARARLNSSKSQITNVKFIESSITKIDLPTSSSDCVISNCVINLVPKSDKHLVFKEIFRILKPGGRLAVSDILARNPFPPELERNIALYVGCVAGASMVQEYEKYLKDAGFEDVIIVDKHIDLNVYKEAADSLNKEELQAGGGCVGINAGGGENVRSSCCGTSNTANSEKAGGGISDGSGAESSTLIIDTDLNEWVGSFNIYAVKAN